MPTSISSNVSHAAEKIHKAFKGMGTDEKAFTQAIASLSPWEVAQLRTAYKAEYGKGKAFI